jgi:N-hydroxyarylamine O-acetyltransferase
MDQQLSAYLSRIGLHAPPALDEQGLVTLQLAHRRAIAFENFDVIAGKPVAIDSQAVFAKLVTRERGGYCFEQNRLYSDMLSALGFANRPLLARVRLGLRPGDTPPRTHMLLLVQIGGERWIADAGFGGSFVPPIRLIDGGRAVTHDGAAHRLRALAGGGSLEGDWLLERAAPNAVADGGVVREEDWQPQYSFELTEVAPDDLAAANHWTSTRPDTRFTTLHIASTVLADGFAFLTDRTLTVHRSQGSHTREIEDSTAYRETLADIFGLTFTPAEIDALPLFTPR